MLRTLIRVALIGVVAVAIVGGVLYQVFGLRAVLDGGGMPRLAFVESSAEQAARVERHREAQRAAASRASAGSDGGPPVPAAAAGGPAAGAPDPSFAPSSVDADGTAPVPSPPPPSSVPYWTDFRGPLRDGAYAEGPIRTDWPKNGLEPVWKQPAGGGYASFAIARGRAFTIEQRGPREVVAAYDVPTGLELWVDAWDAEFRETMGGDGPRATPTWADGRVYALGATGELRALDESSGRVLWRTNILEDSGAGNLDWGMSASPLVAGDSVVVLPGGSNGRSVAAYHRVTGDRLWTALGDRQSYASPMLVDLSGVRQLLVFSAERLLGLEPDDGTLLWEYPWVGPNGINAAQPLVIGGNRIFVSSGYGAGAAVIEVSGSGAAFSVREVWRNTRMKNRFASSVLHEGTIYGLDESILAAVDAATGELKWKGGRYGYGQLLLAGGHLIVLAEDGDLALVRATPERHEEIVRFPVLSGKTWNPPAMAGGYLLVRNLAEMAAFDLRVP
ncbi:MAG TPA: PQQ-binding-like beta-propeller repeat protein [Gemmatimonadaceae bacterium]|nr:PQQ-binding-like beta-propeller repeat protein [Gemmatimonadaceae bacterium]